MNDPTYRVVAADEAVRANRADWDRAADDYQQEHGEFLGDAGFIWCPEGLDEADARLLGEVAGRQVLEVGCGAGQCARWLVGQGARVIGVDLSFRQLQHSLRIDDATGISVPTACADATRLPVASASIDIVCSAFGAFPFLVDIGAALREVSRVLVAGGRLVFSIVHPTRWMFPDDPGPSGLTVTRSYFDRTPYVEIDEAGQASYVEPHHTLEDWTRALGQAGLRIVALTEPEWPSGHDREWGAWGPVRGALLPGTRIISASKTTT
jgi:SAM-dependent methyltransferase